MSAYFIWTEKGEPKTCTVFCYSTLYYNAVVMGILEKADKDSLHVTAL